MAKLAAEGKLLGALGASKGGVARAEALTPKHRSKIASMGGIATREARKSKVIQTMKRASATKPNGGKRASGRI